jgi:hypothetical protein
LSKAKPERQARGEIFGTNPNRLQPDFRSAGREAPVGLFTAEKGNNMLTCQDLANCIENLQPDALPRDVARLCLLLANHVGNLDDLGDSGRLTQAWQEMGLRLQAATDQHAAMTEELETLASSDPEKFSPEQVWVLIRAIKVQSQVLQLYVGQPAIDV